MKGENQSYMIEKFIYDFLKFLWYFLRNVYDFKGKLNN